MTESVDLPKSLTNAPSFRAAICDLGGVARGKRLPRAMAEKVLGEGLRMPVSAAVLDIWGADTAASPLVLASGDADGQARPTERGAVSMPWSMPNSALVPLWLWTDDGQPFAADPRQALARVLARLAEQGLTVQAGLELEFTLSQPQGPGLRDPLTGQSVMGEHILSLGALDLVEPITSELFAAAETMGIPLASVISEAAPGQFEATLHHAPAMRAADNAWLFKMAVKGIARKHGLVASFAAKPDLDQPGNGLHVHASLRDGEGNNIFDENHPGGADRLGWAIAGCLRSMPAATLIFAPHGLSYRRFVPGAHAPASACWGWENRTAALRIPGGPSKARRIEHRVAGADANPYLLLAAILGGAAQGLAAKSPPPPAISGNAYEQDHPRLATDWQAAIEAFHESALMREIFDPLLVDNLVLCKKQEQARAAEFSEDALLKALAEVF